MRDGCLIPGLSFVVCQVGMFDSRDPTQRNSKKTSSQKCLLDQPKDLQKLTGGGRRLTECVTRATTYSQNNDAVSETKPQKSMQDLKE